jgi:hypothetical protein
LEDRQIVLNSPYFAFRSVDPLERIAVAGQEAFKTIVGQLAGWITTSFERDRFDST